MIDCFYKLKQLVNKNPKDYNKIAETDDSDSDSDLTNSLSKTFLEDDDDTVQKKVKSVSKNIEKIAELREKAHEKQKDQAHTMLSRNKKAINDINVDDIALYKVDDVDRGAADDWKQSTYI